jgi:hypothetical protein
VVPAYWIGQDRVAFHLATGHRHRQRPEEHILRGGAVPFARARDCYRAAGLAAKWEQTVRRVCALHNRKTGFIDGFQALVAGAKRSEPPSFLERAKTRWREQVGRDVL